MTTTRWILCAGFEPAKGHREPQQTELWEEALLQGWRPAGPSMQLPIPGGSGMMIFAMVQKDIVLPALPQFTRSVPVPTGD